MEVRLPPVGTQGWIERWDPRPGDGFRMVLTHLDAADRPGRTSDATDVAEGGFAELVSREGVLQRPAFAAGDPSYPGTMTMPRSLAAIGDGTEVTVTATDVPPGIDQAAHETGAAPSLAHLTSYVEAAD